MFSDVLMNASHSRRSMYEEIVNENERSNNNKFWDASSFFRSCSLMKIAMSWMVVLLTGIIIVQGVQQHETEIEHEEQLQAAVNATILANTNTENHLKEHDISDSSNSIKMPSGVNIGSWLSLEDYFFAGLHNAIEVATPGLGPTASKVASCLPPLHVGSTTGPKWQSETDLFRNLMDPAITPNGSVKFAIEVFAAHRSSFVDLKNDFSTLANLGVTTIRIPMSWCWSELDPRTVDLDAYESDEDLLRDFACVDPFFGMEEGGDRILWPAVPKPLVEDILRACSAQGIRAVLDVHTYPGGTSIGTFSGVWPHPPRFWLLGGDGVAIDGVENNITDAGWDIGHKLFFELVEWMEELSDKDPEAFEGLRGLSPMNEPAHLAGNYDVNDPNNWLPPLPRDVADKYLQSLNEGRDKDPIPDGTHLRVLAWFDETIAKFRDSKLPSLGKELFVNIHESFMQRQASWWEDDEKDSMLKGTAIAQWWCASNDQNLLGGSTTSKERSDWAALDVHHYHAWSSDCSGTVDGQDAAYACGDPTKRHKVLEACAMWATLYRSVVDGVCGATTDKSEHSKLMSGEFSAASHHQVRRSCSDVSGLKESYELQVSAGLDNDIELVYWSYKMPYGGAFRQAGWSFQELLFRFGVLSKPDTPEFDCDSHLYNDPELP